MCNSLKIKSLLHKLPLNRAAGKGGIFAEHISCADSSVCNHLSSLFNVCLMHGKIPQECMQTVIVQYAAILFFWQCLAVRHRIIVWLASGASRTALLSGSPAIGGSGGAHRGATRLTS